LYADIGSKQVFIAPYTASGVCMFGFPIKSDDPAALQDYCDRAFNRPSGGQFAYRPLLPYLLLTFADITRLYSSNPPDLDVGWDPERDVIFWLLLVDDKLGKLGPRLTWCVPFIFVNNPQAVLTGREVLGFPKEFATVGMMRGNTVPMPMTVVANVYPKFNQDTQVVWANLMTLKPQQGGQATPATRWQTPSEAVQDIHAHLGPIDAGPTSRTGGDALSPKPIEEAGVKLLIDLGLDLLKLQSECIFLKQFRDSLDGSRACYQSVVQSTFAPHTFRGGGFLPGRYELHLNHYDSHPFGRDLGLTQSVYKDLVGTWINFDFDLGTGTVIWQA
jgi:hypothetical protein